MVKKRRKNGEKIAKKWRSKLQQHGEKKTKKRPKKHEKETIKW